LAYLEGVGVAPSQPVAANVASGLSEVSALTDAPGATSAPETISHRLPESLLEELWEECGAAAWGLGRREFNAILERIGEEQNFGQAEGVAASRQQVAGFLRGLRLPDLVLARACAGGHEGAWEHFVALYQQVLIRAAIAITGSETVGRELAQQLYAELYGLTKRDGERRSPLDSYQGRGSLIGWLRTTLAQRHMDHYRRTRRESSLKDADERFEPPAAELEPSKPAAELAALAKAIEEALRGREAEERLMLAAYYIDERTQFEIAGMLGVHEATVSRRLRRLVDDLRKQVVKNLQRTGLSRRAAEEALGADPRDLDLNLKKMLQNPRPESFQEKASR
jgi:RNA polymerase sigma-70 factor (ECF subfamily)